MHFSSATEAWYSTNYWPQLGVCRYFYSFWMHSFLALNELKSKPFSWNLFMRSLLHQRQTALIVHKEDK